MKRFFPLFLLGLVLALVGSVSVQAKTQSEKTLYVYIQNPSRGGTIQFASPAYKTVNMNGSTLGSGSTSVNATADAPVILEESY